MIRAVDRRAILENSVCVRLVCVVVCVGRVACCRMRLHGVVAQYVVRVVVSDKKYTHTHIKGLAHDYL